MSKQMINGLPPMHFILDSETRGYMKETLFNILVQKDVYMFKAIYFQSIVDTQPKSTRGW
jgi:hypothetical protein